MLSWAQSEVASSESRPQDIPLEQHEKVFSWADVREIVGMYSKFFRAWLQYRILVPYNVVDSNRLDVIRRKPSERVIYKSWCKKIVAVYGSITAYMCAERLHWEPLPSSCAETETGPVFEAEDPTPFKNPSDYKILCNDWPYGSFGRNITHLIVWSKSRIPTQPDTGLVTPESRKLIDAFVEAIFINRLARDESKTPAGERVLWFKNWGALQSVRGLEHIHVLVEDVADTVVQEWTGEPLRDSENGVGQLEHSQNDEKPLEYPISGVL